jgi:sulfate permease, SulP family
VVGFTAGAAVLIAISQVKNFFGLAVIPRGASVAQVLGTWWQHVGDINPYVTSVALATVGFSVASKRWAPRWPNMIVSMVMGSLLAWLLNQALGQARTGMPHIGALRIGLPPLSSPDFDLRTLEKLVPVALAVALLALTEAVSIARAMAMKTGQRIDGNQEFIGQGLSNLAGAFFSGYASSGSFNRSGLNLASGARTPLAAVFSAVFLLLIMLFLAPLAQFLPLSVMAGILVVVAWNLIDFHHMREIVRVSRQETAVLLVTLVATLTLDLEFAIYGGVLLSLLLYLNRTSRPPLEDVMPTPGPQPVSFGNTTALLGCPQLKIVRLNGSIFFGAVNHLQETLAQLDQAAPARRHLLLVASGINFIDLAGAHWLAQAAQRQRDLGGALYLFDLKEEPREMLARSGALETIGLANLFKPGDAVLETLFKRLDAPTCLACRARVFDVCGPAPHQ